MSGRAMSIEAEISGYLKTLKGDNEDQLDVPAFLRRATIHQRHMPTPAPAPAPQKTASANKAPVLQFMDPVSITLRLRRGLG